MKKWKFSFYILVFCFLFFLSGCQQKPSDETQQIEESSIETFVIALPVYSSVSEHAAEEKINKILEDELQLRIDIKSFDFDHYEQNIKQMMANGEQLDILVNLNNMYAEGVTRGDLLPLGDLLEKSGQGILRTVGSSLMNTCTMSGEVYGIPNIRDHAVRTDTYYLNKEILERNQIHPEDIQSLEQLEKVFDKVHKKEPDTIVVYSDLQSLCINDYYLSANASYPIGIIENKGMGENYINLFVSEEYKEKLETIHRWHKKGFVQKELEGDKIVNLEGEIFAYVRCGKPGGEEEMKRMTSSDYYELALGEDVITQASYMVFTYGISKNTVSAEKSMKILELLYQNSTVNNLLKEIVPEWVIPNLFLTDLEEGAPDDLWEQIKSFERNARKSKDVGFVFNPSSVMEEYLNVCDIYSRYRPLLENGLFQYEELLEQMNEEMHQAGIDIVIKEKNTQYQLWMIKQKTSE